MDNEVTTWWNFRDIKNIPDGLAGEVGPVIRDRGEKYLFFADYSLWCWAWAISCTEDEDRGKVAMITNGAHDRFVADSFSDFVARYVSDMRLVC